MSRSVATTYDSTGRARERLGCSKEALHRWGKAGKIGFIRTPGGAYRWAIDEYIAGQGSQRPHRALSKPIDVTQARNPPWCPAPPDAGRDSRGLRGRGLGRELPTIGWCMYPEPDMIPGKGERWRREKLDKSITAGRAPQTALAIWPTSCEADGVAALHDREAAPVRW